ncbi:hypothetical protein DEO23_09090 [Brachybacterium endophyticum]|uniref:Uncharacterized protein n=1 Tax=Brachybacterium endophyticum TaxID=2182385 RepID=A0A2U2RJF8_9MICO|nr:hypothetical protein [Brachybacterium endophyticum]PWH05971.1 hypothetical protein DEO23_09090 [Brachybacterium endophyticum]
MTRRLIGAIASLLAMMAGLWLVLSPFALGFQKKDADWTDATLADVWTGLPIALVGLVGVIVFAAAISKHMVQSGFIAPRPAPAHATEAQQAPQAAAAPAASDRSREMDAMLEPLIAALARDIEREDSAPAASAGRAPETTHHREYGRSAVGTDTGAQAAVAADR